MSHALESSPPTPPNQAWAAPGTAAAVEPERGVPRISLGLFLQVLGLAVAVAGAIGLPQQRRGRFAEITYWNFYNLADQVKGNGPFNGTAKAWYQYALVALGVVTVLVAVGALAPRVRALGLLVALAGAAVLAWFLLATGGTSDYTSYIQAFRKTGSSWDHPGLGIWAATGGLAAVIVGGLITLVAEGRRR